MIKEVIMPKLGETMEEGYLVAWKKEVGEKVEKGDVLFEVMSDKTNFEVESLHNGYLRKKIYEPSEDPIPVITPIAYISDSPDEPLPEIAIKPAEKKSEKQKTVENDADEKTEEEVKKADTGKQSRAKASPLAKKTAMESGIDISLVTGSGPDGRIEKKDVDEYIKKKSSPQVEGETKKEKEGTEYRIQEWTPLRRIIARRLSESKKEIPHYYFQGKLIADEVVKLKSLKKEQNIELTYTDFLLFIAARAIKEYPLINAALVNGEIRIYSAIDIGLAVSVKDGLVVPVLRDCGKKDIASLSNERKKLIEKAHSNKLSEDDVKNARFTISNLGMYSVENFQPVINMPGVAIMGVGKLGKEPVVVNDKLEIGYVMNVSFSFDHRVIDGSYAGLFYKKFKELFENPALLAF
jgi:pyruvate dehydrogenase E2 component (dihydrolipoamide acetyltransferase)